MSTQANIRLIHTRAHAAFDYMMCILLFLSPSIFHFPDNPIAEKTMFAVAICLGLTALVTRFEFSVFPFISLPIHYIIDLLLGVFLLASPWIFNFSDAVYKAHVVFGLSIIMVSLLSDRVMSREVALILTKGRFRAKPLSARKSTKSSLPGLKLVIDPFYLLSTRSLRKKQIAEKTELAAKIID